MRSSTGAQYRLVAGLQRGMNVLAALNRAPGGMASAVALSAATQLHRTTVKRLLETLQAQGYVWRGSADENYRLAIKVRELAEGFTDDEWVSAVALPELGALMNAVVWPSDLTTLDGDSMIIRETTHRYSPLSFHRNMVGTRMPLLFSASGRAYIAFCPAAEREQLLQLLATGGDTQARLARDPVLVGHLIERVRGQGYGSNDGDWQAEPQIGAIALPIRRGAQVLACLNIVYLRRAVKTDEAVARYLPALRQAVERIERGLQERQVV